MKLWQIPQRELSEPDELRAKVERFLAGADVELDAQLARWDVLGSLAHARVLHRAGLLTAQELVALQGALIRLLEEIEAGRFSLSPDDEDVHTAVENRLVAELDELGKKLHTGRSRNDQVLVDTRLYAKEALLTIAHKLSTLVAALLAFARKHEKTPMPGYTHTRRAMPTTVGHWAAAYAEAGLDHLQFLKAAYRQNDRCPLGAAAGYGVPLPLDRTLAAKLLGFSGVQMSTLWAITSRGIVEFMVVAALAALALTLSRLTSDLVLFSAEEFGFFELPRAFTTGSSLMPHKRNPDGPELLRGRSSHVLGALVDLILVVKGLPSGYHRDTQETKGPLLQALTVMQEELEVLSPLIEGLEVHEERLRAALSPELFVTDKVLELAQQGVPFREAYRRVRAQLERGELSPSVPSDEEWLRARAELLGSPGDLQLEALEARLDEAWTFWRDERKRFQQAMQELIEAREV